MNELLLMEPAAANGYADAIRRAHTAGPPAAFFAEFEEPDREPILSIDGDIAVINIRGVIETKRSSAARYGFYDAVEHAEIVEACREVADNDAVQTVLVELNTPGGHTNGIIDSAAAIAEIRDAGKRVIGHARDYACSAGMWLLAACDEAIVSPTGMVGSIGTVVQLVDSSKNAEMYGIRVAVVSTAALKHGYPGEPITAEIEQHHRDQINELNRVFVGHVAERRNLDPDRILAYEGRVFVGRQAIDAGLADRVLPAASLHAEINLKGNDMTTATQIRAAAGKSISAHARTPSAGTPSASTDDVMDRLKNMDDDEREAAVRRIMDEYGEEEAEGTDEEPEAEGEEEEPEAMGDDEEDEPTAMDDDDDDGPMAGTPLAYGAVKAIVAAHLDGPAALACVDACMSAGVADRADVLERVCAAQKTAATNTPALSGPDASPAAHGGGHGGNASRRPAPKSARPGGGGGRSGRSAQGPAQSAYFAAVEAHQRQHGSDRRAAMKAVNKQDAALHDAYMAEIGAAVGT